MSVDPARCLAIYLQDHFAGSEGGVRLAARAARQHRSGELGRFLEWLVQSIREDQDVLRRTMVALDVQPSQTKRVAVIVGELAGRLKSNGNPLGSSPLTPVVELETLTAGVSGKRALWLTLRQLPDGRLNGIDFEPLIHRADDQLAESNGTVSRVLGGRSTFGPDEGPVRARPFSNTSTRASSNASGERVISRNPPAPRRCRRSERLHPR